MIPRAVFPTADIAAVCARWHIRRLSIFGSMARGTFGADSDVDILVEFDDGATPGFFAMEELRSELSALAGGRAVDLVTRQGLHPLLRDRVLAEAVEQFAA